MTEQKTVIRVLMIEDNPDDADLARRMLSKSEDAVFNVEHFECLKPALERIKDGGIDIILSDLKLPDSQGLDTFLRVHAQAADIPIVLLTGTYQEAELAMHALTKGAQDYLRKDEINRHLLTRAIHYAIDRKEAERERERLIKNLQDALAHIKTLQGLLPICMYCKKIRDDKQYWQQIEQYVSAHSEAQFTHGICPDCYKKHLKLESDKIEK